MVGFSASAYGALRKQVNPIAKPSNIGTRVFGGRMGSIDNTTQKTYQVICATAQHFDGIRIICANSTTTAYDVSATAARATTTVSNGTGTTVVGGGFTVPAAASAQDVVYAKSPLIPVSSQDRTDGGTLPLLVMRVYVSSAATIGCVGNGADVLTNWATIPNGRIWIMRQQAGDLITGGTWTSATNVSQSPIVGVEYLSRGKVVSFAAVGDSISEGIGTYQGNSWGLRACVLLSSMSGVAYEWCNLGWSGQTVAQFSARAKNIAAAGLKLSAIFMPNGSPNSGSTPLIQSNVVLQRTQFGTGRSGLADGPYPVIPWTWLPTNTASKAWGAGDSFRRSYNDELRTWALRGEIVADFDSVIAGVDDGLGQIQMKVGTTDDQIHPNEVGNDLMATVAARAMLAALGFIPSRLIT